MQEYTTRYNRHVTIMEHFFSAVFWRKLAVNAQYLKQTIKNKGQCHFYFNFCVDFSLHY